MSVIRTATGWVELGAANPVERAYETSGYRLETFAAHKPEPVAIDWTVEQVRAWNLRLAEKVGVDRCVQPCRCHNGCNEPHVHHAHKTDLRTLRGGMVLFGRYNEWAM